ncbi:hypothetical protein ORI89_18785 [Sphingobacterium sp. UT-1RO-CII-1]|uniref:hypothetical protein n=1 Tax=Sphingobacterium sp. UT-1RO-CII-1 TaxID=2995225 RepID=UPI00227B64C1|nr:hypothetical protein [Sphingobacterium sp. UT-1RO-CII-1]MCY4781704.1 hypothetical protein [Sphingobacterium sp. UT-1RO-CII-1]
MAILRYNTRLYEGTATELAADTNIYAPNELICETDTGVMKRGNGVDKYADLRAIGGGEQGDTVTWSTLSGKPAVIAAGADAADARNSIGAGTSDLVIGTTAETAAKGDHNHAVAAHAASGLAAATTVQALAQALSTRIKALEDAASG